MTRLAIASATLCFSVLGHAAMDFQFIKKFGTQTAGQTIHVVGAPMANGEFVVAGKGGVEGLYVLKYDSAARLIRSALLPGNIAPNDLLTYPDGRIALVTPTQVTQLSSSLTSVRTLDIYSSPDKIALDGAGRLYVHRGGANIRSYDDSFQFLQERSVSFESISKIKGIPTSGGGFAAILDGTPSDSLAIFNASLVLQRQSTPDPTGAAQFFLLAVSSTGRVAGLATRNQGMLSSILSPGNEWNRIIAAVEEPRELRWQTGSDLWLLASELYRLDGTYAFIDYIVPHRFETFAINSQTQTVTGFKVHRAGDLVTGREVLTYDLATSEAEDPVAMRSISAQAFTSSTGQAISIGKEILSVNQLGGAVYISGNPPEENTIQLLRGVEWHVRASAAIGDDAILGLQSDYASIGSPDGFRVVRFKSDGSQVINHTVTSTPRPDAFADAGGGSVWVVGERSGLDNGSLALLKLNAQGQKTLLANVRAGAAVKLPKATPTADGGVIVTGLAADKVFVAARFRANGSEVFYTRVPELRDYSHSSVTNDGRIALFDGRKLAILSDQGTVTNLWTLQTTPSSFPNVHLADNDVSVVYGAGSRTLERRSLTTGSVIESNDVTGVDGWFSPDGTFAYRSGSGLFVQRRNVAQLGPLLLPAGFGVPKDVVFGSDGAIFVGGSPSGQTSMMAKFLPNGVRSAVRSISGKFGGLVVTDNGLWVTGTVPVHRRGINAFAARYSK